jgi:electron transfer flavoprotein-quinone oxidoreductase
VAAGQAVIRAKEREDFSAATLSQYESLLAQSFVLQDFETFRRAPHFLDNPRMYDLYPDLINGFMENLFTVTGAPKQHLVSAGLGYVRQNLRGKASIWQVIRDALEGARSL